MGNAAGGIALIGGSLLQGAGARQAAEGEEKRAKFNAKLAKREGFREEARIRRIGRIEAEDNVTRVAKSGVRLEGSPLEVLADNAAKVEEEALRARQAGLLSSELFRQQAKGFKTTSTLASVGGVLGALGGSSGLVGNSRSEPGQEKGAGGAGGGGAGGIGTRFNAHSGKIRVSDFGSLPSVRPR